MESIIITPSSLNKDFCPIILLHDIFDSLKTWKFVAPQIGFSTGRIMHCVDARNHGRSGWIHTFTLQLMAMDVKKLLRERNIAKAILVGSGMGGSVAMRVALEAPELVEKLIVEDMVPDPYAPVGWQIMGTPAMIFKEAVKNIPRNSDPIAAKMRIAEYLRIRLPGMYPNQNRGFGLDIMPLKVENGKFKWQANLDAIGAAVGDKRFDAGVLSGTYEGETLFLYGQESDMQVGVDLDIPRLFPRAVKVAVPGVTANKTHFENPEVFVQHVVAFINSYLFLNPNF